MTYLARITLFILSATSAWAQQQAPPSTPLIPMVDVKGGTSPMGKQISYGDEGPVITVTVGDFSIGKTTVTQAQWRTVMGNNPSAPDHQGDDLPVDSVTWYQALDFCNRLSLKEGLTPVYRDYGPWGDGTMRLIFADATANGYRLPTEMEWEYAARGGSLSKGFKLAGGDDPDTVGWYRGNSGDQPHPVGQKAPNELGLHDMSGNVLQWCWDGYKGNLYHGEKLEDPSLSYPNARVARGSTWWNRPESLEVTVRNSFKPGQAFDFVGFRVARGPSPELQTKKDADWQARFLKNGTTDITALPGAPAVVPDKMTIPGPPTDPLKNIPTAEVRQWNGAPTLFINGQPNSGLMLWRDLSYGLQPEPASGIPEFADFHAAGINLIQTDMALMDGQHGLWRPDGTLDSDLIDTRMKTILQGNPDALVMFRVHVLQPAWWSAAYPVHHAAGYTAGGDKYGSGFWNVDTFADQKWQKEMGDAAQGLIRYLEEHYGDHIMGYVIGAGDTGEWSPGWLNHGEYDFSPMQREAFRKWLKDPTASIPRDRLADGRKDFFDDPQKDAALTKYFQFHSEAESDALLFFARKFRETLDSLNRKRILGAFFGYSNSMYFRMGTHDLDQVLKSPDIDFIASLSPYEWRVPGGLFASTSTPATIRLNGKLLYNEEDSFTSVWTAKHQHKPGWDGNRYYPPDMWTTKNLLIHKIVGSWLEGGTDWYMDWIDDNWYSDPDLMKTIAATQKVLSDELGKDRSSVAQIAVFGSEKAVQFIRPNDENLDRWHSKNIEPLSRLGAPFDFYDIADLDKALKNHAYRLLVFLEVPAVDPAKLPTDATVLWTYLPGYSAEAASKCIGFPVQTAPPTKTDPVFDPSAVPADGSGAEAFNPHVWKKDKTFWAPAPPVSLEDLRSIAETAGVHFYGAAGDQVLADKNLLLVQSASEGQKEFHLPTRCRVTDAFTGDVVAENADTFSVTLKLGETRLWKTEPISAH